MAFAIETEPKVAFLCHASEDKPLARLIAQALMAQGINVFLDEWEIKNGHSLRRKIDEGLGNCTHFIALLSPVALTKEWVLTELDAALVLKLQGRCKFMVLRSSIEWNELPPLLQGLYTREFTEFERDMDILVADIFEISNKPPLGPVPRVVADAASSWGVSPAAQQIVKLFLEGSKNGAYGDPQISAEDLRSKSGLSEDDLIEAVDELEARGYTDPIRCIGSGRLGFAALYPTDALFGDFDQFVHPWRPAEDAVVVASRLLAGESDIGVQQLAGDLGWSPRRINPAVAYLASRNLVEESREIGTYPWCTSWIAKTTHTRRFVRDRS